MSDELFDTLNPSRKISVVDIGSSSVDGPSPYHHILHKDIATVIGFEPQRSEWEKLPQNKVEQHLPYALGDGQEHDLYICNASGMTSMLKPSEKYLGLFNNFANFGLVKNIEKIPTRTLDSIDEIQHLDFLKIDVQGSEATILSHGWEKLHDAVVIQVEISFMPLYENQATFAQIDLMLRHRGFIPHCFQAYKTWGISPTVRDARQPWLGYNQALEGDMVYVKDWTDPNMFNWTSDQLKFLALIANHCYMSPDLARRAIKGLIHRGELPGSYDAEFVNKYCFA